MYDLQDSIKSLPLDASGTVSWIHIGDTHLTRSGEQNEVDLGHIVDEINAVYANDGIDFVFVPGDIADDGSVAAYELFRKHMDRLELPWFGIVGDHDVHEKSFDNFKRYVGTDLCGAFSIGNYRFFRLNAFSAPRPDSFAVDDRQLAWLEDQLRQCQTKGWKAVLFLHCYPSDLKEGGSRLTELVRNYPALLVDMGHTHYNEISNDGKVLYTATRSTGQIEEGPAGYSITTLDDGTVSWHFVELGSPSVVTITQPCDERLEIDLNRKSPDASKICVRAKIWLENAASGAYAHAYAEVGGEQTPLRHEGGVLWSGSVDIGGLEDGRHKLTVAAAGHGQSVVSSAVLFRKGARTKRRFSQIDQENAIGEWKERGLLGTQLGPNKNGRKW